MRLPAGEPAALLGLGARTTIPVRPAPVRSAALDAPLRLLGPGARPGFLQFFDATFRGAAEEVELVINPTYPGT